MNILVVVSNGNNQSERDTVLRLFGGCHFSWPATFDSCSPSDCPRTELGQRVFKVGQSLRYARMKYFLSTIERGRQNDVFKSLKLRQTGTSPLGPTIWILEG